MLTGAQAETRLAIEAAHAVIAQYFSCNAG